MCNTIVDLGLPLNPVKVEPPSISMTIMGIIVDVVNKTIAIPPDKLEQILRDVQEFDLKTFMTKRELQSLLGRLLYVSVKLYSQPESS